MRVMRLVGLGALALAIAAGGCSKSNSGGGAMGRLLPGGNPFAPVTPGDSVPVTPPPLAPVPLVVCVGFDSTGAGTTGITHWRFANDSTVAITLQWSVTTDFGWPGFPVAGMLTLAPGGTQLVEVPIPVPAGTPACAVYALHMRVTTGGLDFWADGAIRVFGPCPPELPPVISPVEFLGADSTHAGASGISHWRLGNNGDQPFTMHWTVSSEAGWPGFPKQGSVLLQARSTSVLDVPFDVPAGASAGMYSIEMLVDDPAGGTFTRPGGIRVW